MSAICRRQLRRKYVIDGRLNQSLEAARALLRNSTPRDGDSERQAPVFFTRMEPPADERGPAAQAGKTAQPQGRAQRLIAQEKPLNEHRQYDPASYLWSVSSRHLRRAETEFPDGDGYGRSRRRQQCRRAASARPAPL